MLERLEDSDFEDVIDEDALFCSLDTCFDLYRVLTNTEPFDSDGNEKDDVDTIVLGYFSKILGEDFPFNIMTEDYVTLYEKK